VPNRLRSITAILLLLLAVSGAILAFVVGVSVLNADLYGRLRETQSIGFSDPQQPSVLLVVHRLLPEENAVEASIILAVQRGTPVADSVEAGKFKLRVSVYDASGFLPFTPLSVATLDSSGWRMNTGTQAVTSPRFAIPVSPSINGFPFDDLRLETGIVVESADGLALRYNASVQRAVPGRLLHASGTWMQPVVVLTRSPTEKALVLASSAVFLLLSAILAIHLVKRTERTTALEEVLALAGFLLATAGFRDLVGVSRASGTSALEVLVFGVPLLLVTGGMLYSMLRKERASRPLTSPSPGEIDEKSE